MTPLPPWHAALPDGSPWLDMRGRQVVVLGNGTSASSDRIAKLPDDAVVIGVNRIARVTSRCDAILFSAGDGIEEAERDRWAKRAPLKLIAYTGDGKLDRHARETHDVRTLDLDVYRKGAPRWPEAPDKPLRRIGQTPPWALQLAILGGASDVFILGVDLDKGKRDKMGVATHNWTGEPGAGKRPTGGSNVEIAVEFYRDLFAWARSRGVGCWNLCPFPDAPIHGAGWPRLSLNALALR